MTTVRKLILDDIVAKLETISIANGYDNDIVGGVTVQRQEPVPLAVVPAITLHWSRRSRFSEGSSSARYGDRLLVDILGWVIDNEEDVETDAIVDSLSSDIQRALHSDEIRVSGQIVGPIEILTEDLFDLEDGQTYVGVTLGCEIEYRHRVSDPRVVA